MNRNMYMYTSTAPKYDIPGQLEDPRRRVLSNEARKNREKAKYMNLGYVVFLIAALMVAGVVLIGYIRLQADITALSSEITGQEELLNSLKAENAENRAWIDRSIDLEEIKRVAMQELGMVYPKEGQVITYEGVNYDYMRKVSDGN